MDLFPEVAKIDKLIAEYKVWELDRSPYGSFKIKVYRDTSGLYSGYTNLQVVDELGDFYCAVGHGRSEDEVLANTLSEFHKLTSWKEAWDETDFQFIDPCEF